jgi:hypothetical protein
MESNNEPQLKDKNAVALFGNTTSSEKDNTISSEKGVTSNEIINESSDKSDTTTTSEQVCTCRIYYKKSQLFMGGLQFSN